MATVNRLILPVGLPLVILVGLLLPAVGQAAAAWRIGPASFTDLCVIVIFFINGLQVRLSGVRDRALVRALVTVLLVNLVLAPAIAFAADRLLPLPLGVDVGIALMLSVPTTMSSAAVIAVNVGGDQLWAVFLTVVTTLLGSLTAPVAVSIILSAEVAIDPLPILGEMLLIVVLPAAVGYGVRVLLWRNPPGWLSVVPSLAVLAVVWVTMSANAEEARSIDGSLLLLMVAAAVVGHGALLLAAGAGTKGMPVEHAMPVLFVASQKTLPLALTILTILTAQIPEIGAVAAVAAITCLVWHFVQLFGDSALGGRLALRHAERMEPG